MTDSSVYIEAEEKASKYEEPIQHIPFSSYHTHLINRLTQLLNILKNQTFNNLDVELLSEVYHLATDEIEHTTNTKNIETFTRIAHEAKLLLIEYGSV
jgi:hypothetical protein